MDFLNTYLCESRYNNEHAKDQGAVVPYSPTPIYDVDSAQLRSLKAGRFGRYREQRKQYDPQGQEVRFIAPLETDEALQDVILTPKDGVQPEFACDDAADVRSVDRAKRSKKYFSMFRFPRKTKGSKQAQS